MTLISDRIVGAAHRLPRPLLVALDVDGTLAPIVEDPEAARVPRATRATIRDLARTPGVRVALVTGRSASSLGRVVGRIDPVFRALEHGRVVVRPRDPVPPPRLDPASSERLAAFERWAREHAVPHGARLERKGASRAVHVRALLESSPDQARRILRAARQRADGLGLHARAGKAVLEAEAAPGDKGDALEAIRAASRARGVLYAGDDLTDFPAIERAVRLGGIGIFVRSRERSRGPRGARAEVVDGTEALAEVLAHLADALRTRGAPP
jgi:trehalose-phosphatase